MSPALYRREMCRHSAGDMVSSLKWYETLPKCALPVAHQQPRAQQRTSVKRPVFYQPAETQQLDIKYVHRRVTRRTGAAWCRGMRTLQQALWVSMKYAPVRQNRETPSTKTPPLAAGSYIFVWWRRVFQQVTYIQPGSLGRSHLISEGFIAVPLAIINFHKLLETMCKPTRLLVYPE
jgi:hypothetical protein